MAFEILLGSVYHEFVLRLLKPTETPPREHGRRLIVTGAVSLGLWLAVVGGGMLLIPEPKPQPDILPASPAIQADRAGRLVEPAEPDRADRPAPWLRGILFTAVVLCILTFVFWGAYSSLYIAAGLFECCVGVPFREINDWFSRIPWHGKVAVFPVLLAAVFAVLVAPFGLCAALEYVLSKVI